MENKTLIDKAIGFIQKNPKNNLSLQNIADNAGFSLNYFDAIFRQHTGYSPIEYSRIYKLARSALDLRRTQKTILDIALDYGYASPESYTRAFKSFYSVTPSEYRRKYSDKAITWNDMSSRISISHFRRTFPELKASTIESALDFCFTHNPLKYAEDIVGMTIAETEVLTLGDTYELEHFIYVSDYDSHTPFIMLVCETEDEALLYVKLLSKLDNPCFSVRKPINVEWEKFDAEIASLGLTCRCGYDMIYPDKTVTVPTCKKISARLLAKDDLASIKAFKQMGGCPDCHVKAIELHFSKKGNLGMKPIGVFKGCELICLAMPMLDKIRDLKKYDIGAIFAVDTASKKKATELIWNYAIDMCLKDDAVIGNAYADEDDSALGVSFCEHIGLVKIAKNCHYSK